MKKITKFQSFIVILAIYVGLSTSTIHVKSGSSFTFHPNLKGKPEIILWKHDENIVAEYHLSRLTEFDPFKGRTETDTLTGDLTVKRLTSKDSGTYMSEIHINEKWTVSKHVIKVIDPVSDPKVTCELISESKSRTLFCSVLSQSVITYEWTGPNGLQLSGQKLNISLEVDSNSFYTCTVKNEVSHNSASFTLQDCHTDESQLKVTILGVSLIICCVSFFTILMVAVYHHEARRL